MSKADVLSFPTSPRFWLVPQPRAWRSWGGGIGMAALLVPAAAQDYFPTINPFLSPPTTVEFDPNKPLSPAAAVGPMYGLPYRVGPSPPLSGYNIKMGPVLASLTAGVTFSYTSNYNLNSNNNPSGQGGNFTIGPSVGVGLLWQATEKASLSLNVGLSYQWSLSGFNNRFTLAPLTALNYQFSVGEVNFTAFNTSSSSSSATVNPVLSGAGNSSLADFSQISNQTGLAASWNPYENTEISSSYSFGIIRQLGSSPLQQLDSNTHRFNLGVYQTINPVLTVGIAGSGNIINYLPQQVVFDANGKPVVRNTTIQNDGSGWSVGPVVKWVITPFLQFNGTVGYTVQNFASNGLNPDQQNFNGVTFNLSLNHTINENLTQSLTGGRNVNPGTGSNFTETINAGYSLTWRGIEKLPINFLVQFVDYEQSGPGYIFVPVDSVNLGSLPSGAYLTDGGLVGIPAGQSQTGQQYSAGFSAGYSITENLHASLAYQYIIKRTNVQSVNTGSALIPYGDYNQQSVTVSLGYRF